MDGVETAVEFLLHWFLEDANYGAWSFKIMYDYAYVDW
jgi:hypothetical protein